MQIFPHVVFFATSRGNFFYLAREIIFAIFGFLTIPVKLILKFHYTFLAFLGKLHADEKSVHINRQTGHPK